MSNRRTFEAARLERENPLLAEAQRIAANAPVKPCPPLRTTDERGGVLMVVMPDELAALRDYWDARDRVRCLLGKGHG